MCKIRKRVRCIPQKHTSDYKSHVCDFDNDSECTNVSWVSFYRRREFLDRSSNHQSG